MTISIHTRPDPRDGFDHVIMSFAGHEMDTSQPVWRLSTTQKFDWREVEALNFQVVEALKKFGRHLVANYSADHVYNQLRYLSRLSFPDAISAAERDLNTDGFLGQGLLKAFKITLSPTISPEFHIYYIGAFVRWYLWCTDTGLDTFDADVAAIFDRIKMAAPPKGVAVMRQDPVSGPLRVSEHEALEAALRSPQGEQLPLVKQVVTWLFVAFGTNPKSLALLAEEDLIVTTLSDGSVVHELRIPRIKKKTANERGQFRTRKLIPALALLIQRLIEENRSVSARDGSSSSDFRPLIRTSSGAVLIGTVFEPNRFRAKPAELAIMLRQVAEALYLKAYDGSPLNLTPRRLRYTFATKLVASGASPQEVADALDHTDTGYVMVYFNTRSDVVRRLDKAMGLALAPIAQAFMGVVIDDETGATRARDRGSRIKHFSPTLRTPEPVGSCGSFGFCGLMAPVACYTCTHFQAWLDGPHEQVFDALESRRADRLAAGADPKMTQIHDRTMLAVAEVVLRCAERHAAEAVA